jgi:hypothetical protein
MKTLLYRNPLINLEFILKFTDDDLNGLLDIAVDNGEIHPTDSDKIREYTAASTRNLVINDITVFEMVDHDEPVERETDPDPYGLGYPNLEDQIDES